MNINRHNYEEFFILYMDNELDSDDRRMVEAFVLQHPDIQEELALLKRSKLEPEQIVFAGKGSLYRKEEKVRPLPVRWWRIAAAAVLLLGVGIITAVVVNKKTPGAGDIVKGNSVKTKTNSENPVITPVKKENTPVNEIAVTDKVKQGLAPI